jgi:hypothetical protein
MSEESPLCAWLNERRVVSGDLPDGQFCDLAVLLVQPFGEKYFAFPVGQIKFTTRAVPPR